MSAWRRHAAEVFPERVGDRAAQLSATAFFAALATDLRAVYAGMRDEPDLAERIFAFAAWSLRDGQAPALRRSAVDGLLLHLPNMAAGRHDIALRVAPEIVTELEPLYKASLLPDDYAALLAEVESVRSAGPNAAA